MCVIFLDSVKVFNLPNRYHFTQLPSQRGGRSQLLALFYSRGNRHINLSNLSKFRTWWNHAAGPKCSLRAPELYQLVTVGQAWLALALGRKDQSQSEE